MADPITWRNVSGNQSQASGLMYGASASANAAFSNFNQVLEREQQLQRQRHDAQVGMASTAARDILDSYGSADELAAANESGAIAEQFDSLGPYLDREAFRGAADSRVAEMRTQEFAEMQRLEAESRRTNRDFMGGLYQSVITNPDNLDNALNELDNAPAPVTNRTEAINTLLNAASTGAERDALQRRRQRDLATEDAHRKVNEATDVYLGTLEEGVEDLMTVARDSGIPFTPSGRPDYDSASPEAMRRFNSAAEEQDLLGREQSVTRFINDTMREITENRALPPSEARALRAELTDQFMMQTSLSVPDQLEWGEIEKRYGETYNIHTNPFAVERKDVAEEALEVLATMPGFDDLSDSRKRTLVTSTAGALSGTLKIGGNEVSITPEVLKLAMQSQDWNLRNKNTTDIRKNLSRVANSLDLSGRYAEYQEYQQLLSSERQRFISSRGVTPPYSALAAEASKAITEAAKQERKRERDAARREKERARRLEERADTTTEDAIEDFSRNMLNNLYRGGIYGR